jgi:hypothetical protein
MNTRLYIAKLFFTFACSNSKCKKVRPPELTGGARYMLHRTQSRCFYIGMVLGMFEYELSSSLARLPLSRKITRKWKALAKRLQAYRKGASR